MSYNFPNLGNQMLPLFGGAATSHPSFLNQLAAMSATSAATTSQAKRESVRTPEPPPAPRLGSLKMKPNQGHAPMDLENESESEIGTPANATTTSTQSKPGAPMQMHDQNLFLNGLMSATGMTAATAAAAAASGYMFFPTGQTGTAGNAANGPSGSALLMDPTVMMAAAIQQMQSYTGYGMSTAESSNTNATAAASGAATESTTAATLPEGADSYTAATGVAQPIKEVIKTKSCMLIPPNPNAPPPTIRERPPGCRTVFVGGLPESITEEIIREIFDACGEICTLRMSKKNFCHIRYRHDTAIDRAIYLSGYRVRIASGNEAANFGRLHVDFAQARDDQYEYECKQRQLQREQRHRERVSLDRRRSQSPPPLPHYTDHEAGLVSESLRSNDNESFAKAVQTIVVWLERGDCNKRNANVFYSMIQSTHAHVRRLHTDKQQLEEDLRKARECYRKQMLTNAAQFTQIEKVFNAAIHKKVWDHFTKAQRKNIDQWKKLATELRSVQIEDDEMEMSDDDRDYAQSNSHSGKRSRNDTDSLKEENDSLRCQLEAIRNEMSLERTDIKYDSDFREKQIKVLQETIRNMQTQLIQTKMREQKDSKTIEQLELKLKEAGVRQLLLKTKIKETSAKLRDKENVSSIHSETSETLNDEVDDAALNVECEEFKAAVKANELSQIIDIDLYKSDDDVKIIEEDAIDMVATKAATASKEHIAAAGAPKANAAVETKDTVQQEPVAENEAKVIALSAAYLLVHPHGVRQRALCAYLAETMQKHSSQLAAQHVADTLKKYVNIFRQQQQQPENADDVLWQFCGFAPADK